MKDKDKSAELFRQRDVTKRTPHRTRVLVEPPGVALLVIDVQNDFCHPDGVFMRNGAVCESLQEIIEALRGLMEAARLARVPTISIRLIIRADSEGWAADSFLSVEMRPFLAREGLRPNTWGAQLIDGLPKPDYDVEKQRLSGFYNTHLETLLRRLGTQTVVLTGVYTNMCVESTALDAWCRDFRIVLVPDCCAAFDPELHQATMKNISFLGNVLSSKELTRTWTPKA